jgi:hypothetical protein
LPRPHRQQGLAAIERLDLRLLVHTQHERAIRRIQVEADDIANLFKEEWILRELEGLAAMRLESKRLPDSHDGTLTQATPRGHRAGTPVRRRAWRALQRQRDHAFHLRICDRARGTGPRLIEQPVEPLGQKSLPPLTDGVLVEAQLGRDSAVAFARGARQHDAGPLRERLSGGAPTGPALQPFAFVVAERQRVQPSPPSHTRPPLYRRTRRREN